MAVRHVYSVRTRFENANFKDCFYENGRFVRNSANAPSLTAP
jgi:hypothetical protein